MNPFYDTLTDPKGNALGGARVLVLKADGNPATLYSDNGVTAITNPVTADEQGSVSFYAANGTYTLSASYGSLIKTRKFSLFDPADANLSTGGGASNFSQLGGSPTDNAALAALLTSIQNQVGQKADAAAVLPTTSIVNSLTAGGANVPLSAEQGKALQTQITALSNSTSSSVSSLQSQINAIPSTPTVNRGTQTISGTGTGANIDVSAVANNGPIRVSFSVASGSPGQVMVDIESSTGTKIAVAFYPGGSARQFAKPSGVTAIRLNTISFSGTGSLTALVEG